MTNFQESTKQEQYNFHKILNSSPLITNLNVLNLSI